VARGMNFVISPRAMAKMADNRGGNIRVAYLYNPQRVTFVDRGQAGPTDEVRVEKVGDEISLKLNPGRIKPRHSAFENSRKSLVGEFIFNGHRVFVIGNHFVSKMRDDPLFGRMQPPKLKSGAKRVKQAQAIKEFMDEILELDSAAKIVLTGDLNDFHFSPPLQILTGEEMINLIETLPPEERYTYIFEGNSEALDHMLISPSLAEDVQFEIVHLNSEFHDQDSDHDGLIAGLYLPE